MNVVLPPCHGPTIWDSSTPVPDEGVHRLGNQCVDELLSVAESLARHPLPTVALSPNDFELPAVREAMRSVRSQLDAGIGFAIIDRIPLERVSNDIAVQLYWLLMCTVGRPVAQKWDGTLIYDVIDTGRKPAPGNGVRSSKSNQGQGYHTDNAFNTPPNHVALFCLRTAKEGGASGLIALRRAALRRRAAATRSRRGGCRTCSGCTGRASRTTRRARRRWRRATRGCARCSWASVPSGWWRAST